MESTVPASAKRVWATGVCVFVLLSRVDVCDSGLSVWLYVCVLYLFVYLFIL